MHHDSFTNYGPVPSLPAPGPSALEEHVATIVVLKQESARLQAENDNLIERWQGMRSQLEMYREATIELRGDDLTKLSSILRLMDAMERTFSTGGDV